VISDPFNIQFFKTQFDRRIATHATYPESSSSGHMQPYRGNSDQQHAQKPPATQQAPRHQKQKDHRTKRRSGDAGTKEPESATTTGAKPARVDATFKVPKMVFENSKAKAASIVASLLPPPRQVSATKVVDKNLVSVAATTIEPVKPTEEIKTPAATTSLPVNPMTFLKAPGLNATPKPVAQVVPLVQEVSPVTASNDRLM